MGMQNSTHEQVHDITRCHFALVIKQYQGRYVFEELSQNCNTCFASTCCHMDNETIQIAPFPLALPIDTLGKHTFPVATPSKCVPHITKILQVLLWPLQWQES